MSSNQGPINSSTLPKADDKISELRKQIDSIDKQLLALLDQRAGIVAEVGEVKRSLNRKIHDPNREIEILKRIVREPHINLRDAEVFSLFQKLIEYYRSIEKVQTLRKSAQLPQKLHVGFFGFGLISGSIAMSMSESFPEWTFSLFDPKIDNRIFNEWNQQIKNSRFNLKSEKELNNLDVVFLGAPIASNESHADEIAQNNSLVLNLGSVQCSLNKVYGFHPLAGKEESGFQVAQPDLFYGKVICVTNTENLSSEKLDFIKQIVYSLGAEPWIGTSEKHNEMLAYSSHLVQMISMALGMTLKVKDFKNDLHLIPKTAKEFLRLTGSNANMWEPIFEKNQDNVLHALSQFEDVIKNIKNNISNSDNINKLFIESNNIYLDLYKQGGLS